MDEARPPTLTLANIMGFVAVTALGLIALRVINGLHFFEAATYRTASPGRMQIDILTIQSSPILIAWTLLVLIRTIVWPWPSLWTAAGRPGFVACAAASLALIDAAIQFAVRVFTDTSIQPPVSTYYFNASCTLSSTAGTLIAGAWLALILGSRWSPGPTWEDRLGCVVALFWLMVCGMVHGYFAILIHMI